MAWLKKSSDGSVTLAFLLERRVALDWQEAVAIVLEVAEVFERSGKSAVPRHQSVALTPSGTVEFLSGRTQSGDPVSALALMLNTLLPKDRPTQLRLLVSTAGPGAAAYKSMGDFIEALKYFERPGRRNLLATVYQRAQETPVPTTSPEDESSTNKPRKKQRSRRRPVLVPLAVTGLVVAVVAGVVVVMEQRQPGSVSGPAASLQVLTSDAWEATLASTAVFRESAAADLSTVVEYMRDAATEGFGDGADVDEDGNSPDEEVEPSSRALRPSDAVSSAPVREDASTPGDTESDVRQLTVRAEHTIAFGEGAGEGVFADAVDGEATMPPDPLLASALFDSSDVNVTPPVTLRLRVPTLADPASSETVGVVEAIVSATGEVEKVKLLSPPESIHQSMILSAIKTWRFRPATKDGQPVRYRQLIPVAIPR